MLDIKLGTDPELFVFDTKHNLFVSAHDLIPGSKDKPYKVLHGAVQPDGLAAEFNIDAASTAEEWERNITSVLKTLNEMIKDKDSNYELKFVPYAEFDKTYFDSLPDAVKVLGCDPDYNYIGKVNPNPSDSIGDKPFRTAAGHVHIGWTDGQELVGAHFEDCKYVSMNFMYHNLFNPGAYGPMSALERKRLQYYGHSGSFRPKPYGIELRAASNLWVETPALRSQMYRGVNNQMAEIFRKTASVRAA